MKAHKLKSETNKLKNYSLQRLRKRFEIRLIEREGVPNP